MKLHTKLFAAMLIPLILFMGCAGAISYYTARNALTERSVQWLQIRLAEAVSMVKEHENILHKYDLHHIPASIAKAKLDVLAELSSTEIGKNGYIFIVDKQGVVVSHPDKYYVGTDAAEEAWFRQLAEKNGPARLSVKNTDYLAVHDFFAPWNWYIVVVEPAKDTFQTIKKITTALWIFGIGAFFLIFCFLYFFSQRLTRPLDRIIDGAQKIQQGKIKGGIPVQSKNEFAGLTQAFNGLTTHFQHQIEQLQKDREYYFTLCHQTTELLTVTDPGGKFIFVSPSSRKIIGYAPEELLGKKVSAFIHPSEKNSLTEHFRRARISNAASPPEEFQFRHKDGHLCTLEFISKTLLFHPDVHGFVTTSRNINKRKQGMC